MGLRKHISCCKGCTKRMVTPEYNCHMHCQEYIKERLKSELKHRRAMRHLDQKYFMYELKTNIRKKAEQMQRKQKGKANKE